MTKPEKALYALLLPGVLAVVVVAPWFLLILWLGWGSVHLTTPEQVALGALTTLALPLYVSLFLAFRDGGGNDAR